MWEKIKNSLSMKVFLWVFLALTICSMLVYGIVMLVLPNHYQTIYDTRIEENADILFSSIAEMDYEDALEQIYNFCIRNNCMATLSGGDISLNFGEIESDDIKLSTTSLMTDVSFVGSDTEYILTIVSASQTADEITAIFFKLMPVILAVIFILSGVSAWICSKVIVSPIKEISGISERMAKLDMTWICRVERKDEIGVLATNLNTMAVRLSEALNELETANRQLAADVERFQKLEEQRRNFFMAVSHELKTPITILKGQIENMIYGYGAYKNHEKYLPQALKSVEDIEYLVKEILSVTKIESMNIETTLEKASLEEMTAQVVKTVETLAQEKEIIITQDFPVDIIISVNPNLFRKALSNIIGNAVRHSNTGAEVFVSLCMEEEDAVLVVENTGVFLEEENLENLFTPFYRTDKSRSKATGGSGLGLYIVKTILDLHNMEYRMENTKKGVAFYLQLKDTVGL